MAAGGEALWSVYRPLLIQFEAVVRSTSECLDGKAKQYGYRIGTRRGRDRNTVMTTAPAEEGTVYKRFD